MNTDALDIFNKAKTDIQIRNQLIEKNLGLVHYIAHKYYENFLDYDDLVQEGILGLIDAIENYDPTLGLFSSYATKHIKKSISRSIANKNDFIRLPVETKRQQAKYKNIVEKEYMIKGTTPTKEIIQKKLKVSSKRFSDIELTKFNVRSLFEIVTNPEENLRLIDIIPSEEHNTEEDFSKIYLTDILNAALSTLTERELEVIKLRYGFYDRVYSQTEIADKYNCTRMNIFGLEKKALEKLRTLKIFEYLIDQADNPDKIKTFLKEAQNKQAQSTKRQNLLLKKNIVSNRGRL